MGVLKQNKHVCVDFSGELTPQQKQETKTFDKLLFSGLQCLVLPLGGAVAQAKYLQMQQSYTGAWHPGSPIQLRKILWNKANRRDFEFFFPFLHKCKKAMTG